MTFFQKNEDEKINWYGNNSHCESFFLAPPSYEQFMSGQVNKHTKLLKFLFMDLKCVCDLHTILVRTKIAVLITNLHKCVY